MSCRSRLLLDEHRNVATAPSLHVTTALVLRSSVTHRLLKSMELRGLRYPTHKMLYTNGESTRPSFDLCYAAPTKMPAIPPL